MIFPLTHTCGMGLNRTSVGLKHLCQQLDEPVDRRLNRTSVGLKLATSTAVERGGQSGLNRTSVGLKPWRRQAGKGDGVQASIEPAWD